MMRGHLSAPVKTACSSAPLTSPYHPAVYVTVEILSLQREASSMPDWAAYKAHMDMGFRLSGKQR